MVWRKPPYLTPDRKVRHMQFNHHNLAASSPTPSWAYSVQGLRIFSPLWMLERVAVMSVPIAGAGIGLLAAANQFGWVTLY